MNLGGRIKEARDARGIGQKALVDKVKGLTQQALSNLETRDSLTSEFAVAIADALGVSLRWLLSGEGQMDVAEWPFPLVDKRLWDSLPEPDRAHVQRGINALLVQYAPHDFAPPIGTGSETAALRLHEPAGVAYVAEPCDESSRTVAAATRRRKHLAGEEPEPPKPPREH